ncbi:MAG: hypothetical protein HOM21_02085, partial [Halobacteriovoraceae bacterium]|nr:hypothetical protein [Halobacteriovoraceae bacterium]
MQQVSSGFFKTFSFLLIVAFLSSGCAKFSYLVEQGIGQLKLQSRSKKNSEILKDPTVEESIKDKIKLITKYKEYFYRYWGKPSTGIYSKTTILKGEAVTHLVIVSPADKIEALEECFPLVGCFPYLGFFKKASAKEYASKKSAEGFVTYTRPVYAYSTLGKLEDRILSSFFQYKDSELAELIFHELFHTIFFIKDEVELNENLANYFGQVMAY